MQGSSDGSALRLIAWAVFAAAALLPDTARSSRLARATLAIAGAVAAAGVLLELAGVIPHPDYWSAEPSGFLSTSNSLGQLLVLALGASISWSLAEKPRWWGAMCAALCGSALVLSGSRTALVAAALAAVAVAAVATARTPRGRAAVAVAAAAAIALGAGATVWASASAGGRIAAFAAQLLSDRPALWRAAWAQAMTSPLLGEGSRMFSAYYEWSVDAKRLFGADTIASFSPHSEPLDLLVSGGIVGVVLALVGLTALVGTVAPKLAAVRRNDPVWPLVAGLVAWMLTVCVGILDTPALLAASALGGMLLGATQGREPAAPRRIARATAGLAATAGVAVALALIIPLTMGLQSLSWGDLRDVGPAELPRYVAAYWRTHDPSYVEKGLTALIGQTNRDYPDQLASDARMLSALAEKDATWHVHIAYLSAAAQALRSSETSAAQYAAIARCLERGQTADPESSVWAYLRKREASRLGVQP
jgi:O-antigen ligase